MSPYFVPDEQSLASLTDLARQGVEVRILTNSLAATDAIQVYAGYARHRETLLRSGVRLYELRATAIRSRSDDDDRGRGSGIPAKSSSSLHAKNIAVDRQRMFIGSFNLDPRSRNLNTEMGLVVHSAALATRVSKRLDEDLSAIAYELKLSADGRLQWIDAKAPPQDVEPDTSLWRRIKYRFWRLFPSIDWLL